MHTLSPLSFDLMYCYLHTFLFLFLRFFFLCHPKKNKKFLFVAFFLGRVDFFLGEDSIKDSLQNFLFLFLNLGTCEPTKHDGKKESKFCLRIETTHEIKTVHFINGLIDISALSL